MTDIEKLIDQEWASVEGDRRIVITDPADGRRLFAAPVSAPTEVDAAVDAARSAAAGWARRRPRPADHPGDG
jgi:acyl-CoA reductase-like NAD-dependent aldehyde dehydrogenase